MWWVIKIFIIFKEDKSLNFQVKKFKDLTVDEIYEVLRIRNEIFIVEQKCIYLDCDGKDERG